jgi:hypothetical protein
MKALNYKRLLDITNTVPSYRGNVNRFPIGERRQNNKFFIRRDEDGYTVFDIVYGETWHTTEIDRLEYIRLKLEDRKFRKVKGVGKKSPHLMKWTKHTTDENGHYVELKRQFEYHRRDKDHNIVGTVRPDNSFEFTKSRYWQGDRCFLSQHSAGYFTTDSRRGGLIFSHDMRDANAPFHVVWRGMRVNCDTMETITPYEVVIHHVDRKAGKSLLSKYERMFKVSEVMIKAMDLEGITKTCIDIVEGIHGAGSIKEYAWNNEKELLQEAEKYIHDAPLDAFLLHAIAYDTKRVAYRMRYGSSHYYSNEDSPEDIFIATKRKIAKEIYKKSESIFKPVMYEGGKRFPSCEWGVKVMVNGQQVEAIA